MDNIQRRRIYKSVGEIITDSKITTSLLSYDKDKIIVDCIKLTYYGSEKCKYMHERNIPINL